MSPSQGQKTLKAFLLAMLLGVPCANAQEIYRRTDATGRPVYSSSPQRGDEKPAELPRIQRENLGRRIDELKSEARPLCDKRGGVDCAKGPDEDGSVICMDGYRDTVQRFRFTCMESRLKLSKAVFLDKDGSPLDPKSGLRPTSIRASIRNLSPVDAVKVQAAVKWDRGEAPMKGSDTVKAYELEEYVLDPLPVELDGWGLKHLRTKGSCQNCSGVLQGD